MLTIDAVAIVVYQARMRAVGQQAKVQRNLRLLAYTDPLTGLLNERGLLVRALPVIGERPAAMLFIDLDGLKSVNDQQGHRAGNRMLMSAGRSLRDAAHPAGLVARIGGDEFSVLVPDAGPALLDQLVAGVRKALAGAGITASVGAAFRERVPDRTMLTAMLDEADRAMYRDKTNRRAASEARTGPPSDAVTGL